MLLRICLIIAILGGGAVVAVNFVMVQNAIVLLKDDRDHQKTDKEKAQTDAKDTHKKLDATTKTLESTKKDLAQTKLDLESANSKVEDLGKQKADLTDRLAKTQAKRDEFQADLAKWEQLHLTPEQVIKIQADLKQTTVALAGVNSENKLLNSTVLDLKNQLLVLIGTNNDIPVLPSGLRGSIVAVDPKYDFVVLNIGKDKGVLVRGIMMVAREGKLIGKVQIASVSNTQCVANIIPAWRRGDVMEGDEVVY